MDAKNALKPGSGYWCSAGGEPENQTVTWTGMLKSRRKIKGIKIKWAYGPGEVKVLTSLDGTNFEEASCWEPAPSGGKPRYGQDVMFDETRNVKAVTIAMKRSSRSPTTNPSWPYFGIDEVGGLVEPTEPGMLVSGITAPKGEQCLVAKGGTHLGLETCMNARASGEYKHIFKFNEEGQLEHADSEMCVITGNDDVVPPNGSPVALGDCKAALNLGDGRSLWELSADNQLKMSKEGKLCLVPKGTTVIAEDCDEAAKNTDARDKWFMATKADYDAAWNDAQAMKMAEE